MTKGIEYFVEIIFFYGVIFAVCAYEIRKSVEASKHTKRQIDELFSEQRENETEMAALEKEMEGFEDPSETNHIKVESLRQ